MHHPAKVDAIQSDLHELLNEFTTLQCKIRDRLEKYSDQKNLKGNEIVGWLGEIYARALFDGRLVQDSQEHDVETPDGRRISVKTRKGRTVGWRRSSAIPSIDGEKAPTHLLFVHLDENYSLLNMWLFDWRELVQSNRLKPHSVRGKHRSYIFTLEPNKDKDKIVYAREDATSALLHSPNNAERLARSIAELDGV